ncbi:MAG: acyl carrier protein [Planctomycetes bacterium]|nr:acyl carrier protein [Planctomycetota bacterium]
MTTVDELTEFIRSSLNLKDITEDSGMGKVRGWDSLNHVSLVMSMEEEYDIEIPPDMIGELTSVAEIVEFFKEEGAIAE